MAEERRAETAATSSKVGALLLSGEAAARGTGSSPRPTATAQRERDEGEEMMVWCECV